MNFMMLSANCSLYKLAYFKGILSRWLYRQGDITIQLLSSLTMLVFSIGNSGPVNEIDIPGFLSNSTNMQVYVK